MTEAWVEENLYCPGCSCDSLDRERAGKKVLDFRCPECRQRYELKSQRRPFGSKVVDAAWRPMKEAVVRGNIPNFLFLHYLPQGLIVSDLMAVPSHFITQSVIERRKPLKRTAKRAGWVGCNILLNKLPPDARISIVKDQRVIPPEVVRESWQRFAFLKEKDHSTRGWMADVLLCIRRLDKKIFTLDDVYGFEEELQELHPRNRHVRAKIRQQLQVLRDRGFIKFLGDGVYLIVG